MDLVQECGALCELGKENDPHSFIPIALNLFLAIYHVGAAVDESNAMSQAVAFGRTTTCRKRDRAGNQPI